MTLPGRVRLSALRNVMLAGLLGAAAVAWVAFPGGAVIESPSFGGPAIVTPGADLPVVARLAVPWVEGIGSASLENGNVRIPLATLAPAGRGPRQAARFRVPAGCPPGNYDLAVRAGRTQSRARRAVSVLSTIPERFTVAQITDLHFGHSPDGEASVERMVDELNRVKADLVMVTGDIAQDGHPDQYDRAQRVLGKLVMPFVCVPGNHDRRGLDDYVARFGFPYRSVAFGRWTVIGLDCGHGRDEFTESQLLFIRRALDEADPRRVIVLAHIPLAGKRSVQAHAGDVMRLFEQMHVPLVLSGHWHYGAEYGSGTDSAERAAGGTRFVVTATAGGPPVRGPGGHSDPRGFTLVTVDDGRITSVETRSVEPPLNPVPVREVRAP